MGTHRRDGIVMEQELNDKELIRPTRIAAPAHDEPTPAGPPPIVNWPVLAAGVGAVMKTPSASCGPKPGEAAIRALHIYHLPHILPGRRQDEERYEINSYNSHKTLARIFIGNQ
jgi:hypothetical protein